MIGTTEKPCPEAWTQNCVHFRRDKPKGINKGDRMVLYAVGRKKQVFALAEVTSEVYENGQQEWRFQMDVRYIVNLPVKSGIPIEQISAAGRDLVRPIQWGSSYIELLAEEYERAAALLHTAAASPEAASSPV
jgi:hypothetical protein